MPLFDFRCRGCGRQFEALVRTGWTTACPGCQSTDLERQLPVFSVSSAERTRAAADKNIKKAAAVARRDNIAMEKEIDEHRHEDH